MRQKDIEFPRNIITFLYPSKGCSLSGGLKVIGEYANRLARDGYRVHIVYAGSLFWRKKSLRLKLSNCIRYLQTWLGGYSCRRWFALDAQVKEHWAFSLNRRHVPKSDVYVATSPYTAMYLKEYMVNRQFYFIQGYENWGNVSDIQLRRTYHYPLQIIVISHGLQRIMEEENVACHRIPNGFDFDYFQIHTPIRQKEKYVVTMLYHEMKLKGCDTGFAALALVKQKYPQLCVNLFGMSKQPANLPGWYRYFQCPDKVTHNRIYNEAAIFIGTSNREGWGLTVGEAMICGQAVACTDNSGYREMAIDNETALLSPIQDAQALAANVIRLIEDDELRYRIAENGHRSIKKFRWDESYRQLRKLLCE
jgi:glycosyltransferase involved in cell wall biosynthesis